MNFEKTEKQMGIKNRLILYSILYWSLFVVIPFLILLSLMFLDITLKLDLGWFAIYYILINPVLFIIYLLLAKRLIANPIRFILISCFVFIVISVFILINIFNIGMKIVSQIKF